MVGKELAGCKWVGVPFAGGMSELAHIKASTIVVGDLHRDVINLAHVVAFDTSRRELIEILNRQPFHPEVLDQAQRKCDSNVFTDSDRLYWAAAYFTCCWMGRSAKAGTDDEFKGGLPVRWSATGGDSNTRYRSAIESLEAWGEIMRRCNFVVQDVFEFLFNVKDLEGHGLYLDPPFPGPGDAYKHKFTEDKHRKLAARLASFENTRVVCRFYDVPLIRELYPEPKWTWRRLKGRKQSNEEAPEVLVINGPSYAEAT
jgi:site-specific DNA-adenine methylase